MASVLTSVRNMVLASPPIPHLLRATHPSIGSGCAPPGRWPGSQALTGSRLRAVVARRKAQRKCRAASHFAVDGDRAVKLFDDPLRDRETEAEAAPLGRDEVVEDFRESIGRNARTGVGHGNLDVVAGARRADEDPPAC